MDIVLLASQYPNVEVLPKQSQIASIHFSDGVCPDRVHFGTLGKMFSLEKKGPFSRIKIIFLAY